MSTYLWPPAMVDALKVMAADGILSLSEMARELSRQFGWRLTRNAVIGKMFRLKLKRRPPKRGRKPQPSRAGEPYKHWPSRQNPKLREVMKMAEPVDVTKAVNPRTFVKLKPGECHWPYGHPRQAGFHFCGGKQVDGFPYCAAHVRMAYQLAGPVCVSDKARAV